MTLDNDTRGWIMTAMSGIACILGASIICVDIFIRLLPGKRNFKIQDSNAFLSSSLSLSFGVMLFSALYSMLPSAKRSLQNGGFSSKAAAWTLIACFLAGAVGIQVISRVLHHFIPHHVVDCDHSHDEESGEEMDDQDKQVHQHSEQHTQRPSKWQRWRPGSAAHARPPMEQLNDRPLTTNGIPPEHLEGRTVSRRPSLHTQLSKVSQIVTGSKAQCDQDGECFGYSGVCGSDCFKNVQSRGGSRNPTTPRHLGLSRRVTAGHTQGIADERSPLLPNVQENAPLALSGPVDGPDGYTPSIPEEQSLNGHADGSTVGKSRSIASGISTQEDDDHDDGHHTHHHHVPANAFLSIGLQTSIAIALHKLPEGFITYATNHANPRLGFAVFLALFIHNITEGFAMALPLYLAINSRPKAMFWSSLLGGASQPLGAGVAAIWFKLAGTGSAEPGEGVYGGMFAVTAGIMASVALQLFSESLDLTHNRNLCMAFAFVGMGILGISSALTA